MKRYFAFLFLAVVVLSACTPDEKDKEEVIDIKVTINTDAVRVKMDEYVQLDYTVTPSSASIEWSSSDNTVAKVGDGMVRGVNIGHAIITARAGNSEATCEVFVTNPSGATAQLNVLTLTMQKGETFQMECYSSYGFEAEWSSDAPQIVSVDDKGLLTALAPGMAKITAEVGAEELSAVIAVQHTWSEYELVWSDEFDGSSLNTEYWTVQTGVGANGEAQHYTDRTENIRVKDGCLEIEARKETYGSDLSEREYTSGRMSSKGKKAFLYGKMEARISFPNGAGTWPAFWMMGETLSWPYCGEIDIVEHAGRLPNTVSFAVHTPDKNLSKNNNWSAVKNFSSSVENEFHVYGIEWKEEEFNGRDQIVFSVDGVEYATVTEDMNHINDVKYWPFVQEHYFILNLALGGNMGLTIDDAIFDQPVVMKVDWVRAYQRTEIE